jgi:hypothetical protein
MANEVSITVNLVARKGGAVVNPGAQVKSLTMAGDDTLQATQLIGFAAAELIALGEITGAPAALMLTNLDATNFVLVGFTNPPTEMKLLPGVSMLISPAGATIYAKADTAACRVLVAAVEA